MAKKGPKRIAGVKVPKKLRKKIGKTEGMLRHPVIADLIAAGLIAAAAAIRNNKKVRSAARTAKDKAGDAAQEIGAGVASLGTIIAAKAREGVDHIETAYQDMGASNGSGRSAAQSGSKGKAKKKKK